METITHAEVQELVQNLPETKLPLVFLFLQDLADSDVEALSQADFTRLSPMESRDRSLDERRQILAQQAERMQGHYEQTTAERTEWQAGEFSDG